MANIIMDEPLITANRKYKGLMVVDMVFVPLFAAGSIFTFITAFADTYPEIGLIALSAICAGFAGMIFYKIWREDNLEVYADKLVIKSPFGNIKKTIFLNEIDYWNEEDMQRNRLKWMDLIIYCGSIEYRISSRYYDEYEAIKKALTKGKQSDPEKLNTWVKRNGKYPGLALIALSIYLFYSPFSQHPLIKKSAKQYGYKTIKDVMAGTLAISKNGIGFKLKSFPEFKFFMQTIPKKCAKADYTDIKPGDSIAVDIMTDQYLEKLTKEKPLSLWNKISQYHAITVLGFQTENHICTGLSDFNTNEDTRSFNLFVPVSIGFISLFAGAIFLSKTRRQSGAD